MDPFETSRADRMYFDELVQHTFRPRPEQLPVSPSPAPGFGRLRLAPIENTWRNLLATLAVRPWLAGHRS